ncbi:TRM11 family methyltransferase [Nocardioides sp. CFH 31398]|uniref:TRM11 family SAM-dependent methyltransferase n=1 Tax=Nocardioides sp. CFH 31398 TaxID=2919579 RepID=UPI001F05C09D|nr:site-specific DNA-methyltransferase [Nocardioides sp. CFH 31398]MCH1867519.1 site-specific DNA-methyltransferase [Nocardioides sp. CFH 31398]
MTRYLALREPSANHVYTQAAGPLALAELALLCPEAADVAEVDLAGVSYVALDADGVPPLLGHHSALLALFEDAGSPGEPLLRPVGVERPEVLPEDLVTIPKYPGKTNEQFTRLMVNLALAAVRRPAGRRRVLDPMCGRGTTLTTALRLGHDAVGVDRDPKVLDATAAFLKTWLRRGRLKHSADVTPVRREGRRIGRRLDVTLTPPAGGEPLALAQLEGDGRRSAELCGRRGFDAVVLDAPYGVVHGAHRGRPGAQDAGVRERSPGSLLAEGVPVWAGQLHRGGTLAIAWNTRTLSRDELLATVRDAGLEPLDDGPWRDLSHRVDSSIQRDLLVAVRPTD